LVIPAAYHSTQIKNGNGNAGGSSSTGITDLDPEGQAGLLFISRGTAILLLFVYITYIFFQLKTHCDYFEQAQKGSQEQSVQAPSEEEEETQQMSIVASVLSLLGVTVGNAAEHFTAVTMAMKNKMEVTITISVGSSIQIAAFVVPLLVIIGWISGHELTLYFANFETIVLFVSVLLVNTLVQDGKSNYMEGTMLITLYIVIALSVWVTPK
ncbi:hypothetical protein H0H92_014826, partial [Tricholoma furcatifolium]